MRRKWQDILRGDARAHTLKLGYYCVRLPDDAERARYSREEMEVIATEFLRKTSPWCELYNLNRIGVRALVNDISKLLMRIIEEA